MELYEVAWFLFGLVLGVFIGFVAENDRSHGTDSNESSIDTTFVDKLINKYNSDKSDDNNTLGGTA